MSSNLDKEQWEIISEHNTTYTADELANIKSRKLRGDIACRIVKHYLESHLPDDVKLVTSAWIEGCPNEFDILVVNKRAEPFEFTNLYKNDDVYLIVEVKSAGVYFKNSEIEKRVSDQFSKIKKLTKKPILFLSIWGKLKVKEKVSRALGEENAFFLILDPHEEINQGEWKRFLSRIRECLGC